MAEAYKACIYSGIGSIPNPYTGAANLTEFGDDNSLGSITKSISAIQMANDTNL